MCWSPGMLLFSISTPTTIGEEAEAEEEGGALVDEEQHCSGFLSFLAWNREMGIFV